MQAAEGEGQDLQYPTIPFKNNFATWLACSQEVAMTSIRDDSSVDDNMSTSTIEDSAWDIIDEASVATSDDEDRNLSRQQTPSNDGLDQDNDARDGLDDDNNGENGNGLQSSHSHASLDSTLEDLASKAHESWASEATNLETPRQSYSGDGPTEDDFAYHEQDNIKFNEPTQNHPSHPFEVCHFIKEYQGQEGDGICHTFHLNPTPLRLNATLVQQMSPQLLNPNMPFRLLYIGSPAARRSIIQKISTALACSLSTNTNSLQSPSSRYSIVPISAFGGGSSPEVLLVDHMGLEINVEDCSTARYVKEELGIDGIVLITNESRRLQSIWDGTTFTLSGDYKLPSLAIIYVPENETALASETRVLAKHLLRRHDVPVLTICSAQSLYRPDEILRMQDRDLPHFCLEGHYPDQTRQLRRLPIDLSCFLAIDALQMNKNLASVIRDIAHPEDEDLPEVSNSDLASSSNNALAYWNGFVKSVSARIPPYSPSLIRYGLLILLGLLLSSGTMMTMQYTKPTFDATSNNMSIISAPVNNVPSSSVILTQPTSAQSTPIASVKTYTIEQLSTKSISPYTATDLTSLLLGSSNLTPNTSDEFKLHIIGDCHVVLRPPRWFTLLKKAPSLHFKISRQDQVVDYSSSTLFEGVYALKLSREEAHGPLNVTVWTTKKPKINETFQVDFGSPWLKVAGWKKATQVMTEQLREELRSAQTGLSQVYTHTSTCLQAFIQGTIQNAEAANREIERYRMKALDINEKVTDSVINQLQTLSHRIATSFVLGNTMTRSRFTSHAQHIQNEVSKVTGTVSKVWQSIERYREMHLVESQKQSLRLWWKIRGGPPARKIKTLSGGDEMKQISRAKVR
ncbi:MAG: hypothetical protein MMC33_005932 [Icmadophila ericetorum]|nr:hypothetical protein [Icmadophila ericetorum]